MEYLKKFSKSMLIAIISILLLTFIFTLLNYFNIINNGITNIFKIIIPLFSLALGGYILGKNTLKNGWLEGIKLGLIIVILIIIGNLIFRQNINVKDLIYYLILWTSTIFGSMFGINRKIETK